MTAMFLLGFLLSYLALGSSVVQFLISGLVIKGSEESFLDLAGEPTWLRVTQIFLGWPLVLGHVLLVRWPLPKRETVYRTVSVQNRISGHYELEKATRFLGRCYFWQPVTYPDGGIIRRFSDWASAVNAAKQLNEEELNQRFKVVRRAGQAFSGRIWLP